MENSSVNRKDIALIAQNMLDGNLNYLLGAEQLVALRDDFGVYANDPDFVVFIAVSSELEVLRNNGVAVGESSAYSASDASKVSESLAWARDISLSQCESLVKRYSS
ncbi:MAG: hypothetical protein JKY01_00810 [Pseudomonadales bacterium]|nr:hypothetical protein [Pseudomonadales bacterium]